MAMATRVLSPDELLTTTRSVRKRLDLTRPVERELLQLSSRRQAAHCGPRGAGFARRIATEPALSRRTGHIARPRVVPTLWRECFWCLR